jgi:hypothetical protein
MRKSHSGFNDRHSGFNDRHSGYPKTPSIVKLNPLAIRNINKLHAPEREWSPEELTICQKVGHCYRNINNVALSRCSESGCCVALGGLVAIGSTVGACALVPLVLF